MDYFSRSALLFLTLSLTLFHVPSASAEDYWWMCGLVQCNNIRNSTPDQAARLNFVTQGWNMSLVETSPCVPGASENLFSCPYERRSATTGNVVSRGSIVVQRSGTGCTSPKVYDPLTGICSLPPDQCADREGDSEPFSKTGPRGDGYYTTVKTSGGNLGVTPDSACLSGCAANLNQECIYTISADRYICIGTAYFTGQSCIVGEPAVDSEPNPTDIEPEVTNDDEPCVYVQDGEGRMVCVSRQVIEEDGQNCGTAGPPGSEQRVCRPKEATKDEKKTETEIEEKPTPDGGTETVKKDVHTETKCHGSPNNCTTTTTTTTTTTKKDGSGTTTKTEVKCTGAKCGDDGKGGSGGGGGGSGNGDGEGEEEGGGNLPGNDDVPGFGESLGSFTSNIQGSPIVAAVGSISFPDGGSCNMPSSNVYMLGTISFDWFCQNANILDALYYVMLGVWALGAVRLFLEA